MEEVEWGEYKIKELFDSVTGDFDIQKRHINNSGEFVVTAGLTDNGVLGKSDVEARVIDANTITIDMFGNSFYRQFKYKLVTHARVFALIPKFKMSEKQGLFIVNSFKTLPTMFGYENMCSWTKIKDRLIKLPIKDNQIDFDFMDTFIAELEAERIAELSAYLKVSGLDNYELSDEELKALRDYDSIDFEEFEYQEVFDKIVQGRRLKKDDQIPGDIPFVMSGVTNTGIVNFISNPVASFPRNSITLDIFGNAFYRPYAYGAGDDTGVYWNEENEYSKEVMLYITSSMSRSVAGKYDYGNKLRSSKSKNIKMKLPAVSKGVLDTDYMRIITNAVMKLAIKDVVQYTNERIETTKEVVTSHNTNY